MNNCSKMISFLLHSRTQTHVFHWQTKSYSEHKALGKYYEEIVDLLDSLVESYQGKYGILMDYETFPLENYSNTLQVVEFLDKLATAVEVLRQDNDDSYLQNQIDNVIQLLETTKYKLKFLG
jgi:hypothetical protein